MENSITIDMADEPVRFTLDGKVFVEDAIRMIIPDDEFDVLWERLKKDHPDVLDHCEDIPVHEGETMTITDTRGWGIIMNALQKYLFN
jgi:hypothetical protein